MSAAPAKPWPKWRIAFFAGIPLGALILLRYFDVPIGQPSFLIYRYSPWLPARIVNALPALFIGGFGIFFFHRFHNSSPPASRISAAGAMISYAALIGWTFFAPPAFVDQHTFNMLSPSHDGAFLIEGRRIDSIQDFLSVGFYERLQCSPEDMRGRRVLSNPPGMTVLAILADRTVAEVAWLRSALIAAFGLGELDDPQQQSQFAASMLFAMFLTALWGAAMLFAYPLCRIWLPPSAAACLAFASIFNPATVNFTPGKDPAQLFFVSAILYGVLAAFNRGNRIAAVIAGLCTALGATIGLIHLWIAAITAIATLWLSWRDGRVRAWLLNQAVPFASAFVAVLLIAYLALDWNILRTIYRVAVRYGEIQLPIITDPFYWTLIGLPMFLLFVGPTIWAQFATGADIRDCQSRTGLALLIITVAAMTYTYFFANNSETPRLWIPFIPLLLVALALRRSAFRTDDPRARRLHVLLIALQLALTVAHWTMMDARESEWRLHTGRMWD